MERPQPKAYRLGEFLLEPAARRLSRAGDAVHLSKLPFQVLVHLVENRDRVVTRAELLERFWEGRSVYDDTLRKAVGAIRKALGDVADEHRFVETRVGEGYRYVGPLEEAPVDGDLEPAPNGGLAVEGAESEAAAAVAPPPPKRRVARQAVAAGLVATVALALTLAFVSPRHAERALPPVPAFGSVAVLPFDNFTGEPAEEYFCDGVGEAIVDELSRVNNLRVLSHRSAYSFKGKGTDPREIGRRLGVDALVEGRVERSGASIRIEARLVSTTDGRVLWAGEPYEGMAQDIFEIEDRIACDVASELRVALCGEGERVGRRYTRNVEAYRAYLRGRFYWNKRDAASLKRAVEAYEEAVRIDPSYALAYAGLAEAYAVLEANQAVPPGTAAPKAEAYARKAMELDDTLPGAYAALGLVEFFCKWRWREGEELLRRALERNPNYVPARQWYASFLRAQGRVEEGIAELARARDLDPLSFPIGMSLAEAYLQWRKPDQALDEARALVEIDPSSSYARALMAKAYLMKGMYSEAREAAAQAGNRREQVAGLLAAEGRLDEARKAVEEIARSETGERAPFTIACLYARLGDREAAIAWLERAYAVRQADLAAIKVEPALDPVRSDPRYHDIVRRVGLE